MLIGACLFPLVAFDHSLKSNCNSGSLIVAAWILALFPGCHVLYKSLGMRLLDNLNNSQKRPWLLRF